MLKKKLEIFWNLIFLLDIWFIKQHQNTNPMTTQEFYQVAVQKFSKLSTQELIKSAIQLNDDFSDASMQMFNAVLDILMERMPEQDFVKFCDEL